MTTPVDDDPIIFGKAHFRTVAGAFLLLLNGVLLILDALSHEAITVPDVAMHGSLLLASYLLISKEKLTDILTLIKDKLPTIGGGV